MTEPRSLAPLSPAPSFSHTRAALRAAPRAVLSGFATFGLLAGLLAGAGIRPACAATEELKAAAPTLYERIAAGPLVVRARCRVIGKRATVDVLDTMNGSAPAPSLQ